MQRIASYSDVFKGKKAPGVERRITRKLEAETSEKSGGQVAMGKDLIEPT